MLTIRREQLQTLESAAHADLIERLIVALVETYPSATRRLSHASLSQRVTEALAIATALGCESMRAFADLTGLVFELGPSVHRSPAIAAILADPRLSPDDRVAAIFERLSAADWAAVVGSLTSEI